MTEKTLDREQAMAVDAIVNSRSGFILTGGPGTGKTTTLKAAIEALEQAGKRYLLLAPTGKAAMRISETTGRVAGTIHRLLWSKNREEQVRSADVIVVDESSMVDIEIMGQLCRLMQENGLPRLVLVGDPNQLPPVGPGAPFEDAIKADVFERVHLTQVYRQKKGSWVIDNAYKILAGEMVSLVDTADFTFVDTDRIELSVLHYFAAKDSEGANPSSYQVLSPQRRENDRYDSGATTQRINRSVQEHSPASAGIFEQQWGEKYREGDRVVQTKNNYRAQVVNGQMGTVLSADADGLTVRLDDDKELRYSEGGNETMPSPSDLDLAFAVTVHKSQGSQWKSICFVMDAKHTRMLQRRLFYTAITRSEDHLTIIGSREAVARAVKTDMVDQRNTLLVQKLKGDVSFDGTAHPSTR